jgi:cysteine synthase
MTKLLNRQKSEAGPQAKVAFIDLENKSVEELGDFREQLIQIIETLGENTNKYRMISRRYVQTALAEVRLQPNQVMIPKYMRQFAQVLEQQNQPVDFLLYAVLTSGTTTGVASTQRDYLLSLELINVRTGDMDKESERVRKEYQK